MVDDSLRRAKAIVTVIETLVELVIVPQIHLHDPTFKIIKVSAVFQKFLGFFSVIGAGSNSRNPNPCGLEAL